MRSRSAYAMGVTIVLFAACGGEPFSTEGADAGRGGESAGSAGKTSGTGGSSSKAGTTGKGGSSSGKAGSTSVGGSVIGVGGDVSVGGVVGVSGTGMTGEAGAPVGMSCTDPSMCPSSRCVEATCNSGECGAKNLPDGPINLQVPGDCQQARCEGGKEVLAPDPTDKDDKNECTKDSCGGMNGAPLHAAQTGQACANGGTCSPAGKCEICPLDCPVSVEPCQVSYCTAGTCKTGPAPVDKLCPKVANPNDQYGQCDGQGHCVDCTNSGACDEASACGPNNTCVPA